MLDRKVLELTDGLIQTQFDERRKRLPEELRTAAMHHNARGSSGAHLQQNVAICRHEIEIRVDRLQCTYPCALTTRH
jgi:hypothetical protein